MLFISNRFDPAEDKAFFLETSGSAQLNVRQACAVESLARHNPDLSVHLLMTGHSPLDGNQTDYVKMLGRSYRNVRVAHFELGAFLAGSPLEHW